MKYKQLLDWLIKQGKIKANSYYFLFFSLFFVLLYLIFKVFPIINFSGSNLMFTILITGLNAIRFYDFTIRQREKEVRLRKQGLTEADLKRIEFVKAWEHSRSMGIKKYCLQNGGIVFGIMLLIPASFIALLLSSIDGVFPSIQTIGIFLAIIMPVCYVLSALVYLLRWNIKEKKFRQLTGQEFA